jgi:hypothetical protein
VNCNPKKLSKALKTDKLVHTDDDVVSKRLLSDIVVVGLM